jgi:hypothetical protein
VISLGTVGTPKSARAFCGLRTVAFGSDAKTLNPRAAFFALNPAPARRRTDLVLVIARSPWHRDSPQILGSAGVIGVATTVPGAIEVFRIGLHALEGRTAVRMARTHAASDAVASELVGDANHAEARR